MCNSPITWLCFCLVLLLIQDGACVLSITTLSECLQMAFPVKTTASIDALCDCAGDEAVYKAPPKIAGRQDVDDESAEGEEAEEVVQNEEEEPSVDTNKLFVVVRPRLVSVLHAHMMTALLQSKEEVFLWLQVLKTACSCFRIMTPCGLSAANISGKQRTSASGCDRRRYWTEHY